MDILTGMLIVEFTLPKLTAMPKKFRSSAINRSAFRRADGNAEKRAAPS